MAELLAPNPRPDPSGNPPAELSPQCLLATTCVQALAQGGRLDGPGHDRAGEPDSGPAGQVISAVQRMGATALHLSEGPIRGFLAELVVELLLRRAELPVVAVDATLGAIRLGRPRAALACAGSLDRREAEEATAVATAALSLAAELGAPFVSLRLGAVEGLAALWEKARSHFLRGALASDEAPAEELMHARSALAVAHLDAALRSLDRLVNVAERLRVTVLLPNPRRAVELPTPIELWALRSEFDGAPLAPLLDVPAAHLASAMHLLPLRDSVLGFGVGPLANLSDGCGAVGGLPPGHGEVELAAIARTLAPTTHREFVPWPALRPAEVAAGYRAVAALQLAG